MMFSVFCPTHDATVLMTRRNAISFWNSDDGPVIRWRCNCGHEGELHRSGSVAEATNASAPDCTIQVQNGPAQNELRHTH